LTARQSTFPLLCLHTAALTAPSPPALFPPAHPFVPQIVDVGISLWGIALNGVIAGVISTLTLLVNFVRIAETAKLKRQQKEDVSKVVEELEAGDKLDFEAFYDAMEHHAHTNREEAHAIFEQADVDHTGLLTKTEAEKMIKNWKAPDDVEQQTPEQVAIAAAKHPSPSASPKSVKAPLAADSGGDSLATGSGAKEEHKEEEQSWLRVLAVFCLFMFVLVPATLCIASVIFGAMLADAEGWSWNDGFLYVITNLCVLGGVLTPASPTTDRGRAVDIVIGLWTLSVQGTIIGVVGALSVHERLVRAAEGAVQELHNLPFIGSCFAHPDADAYDDEGDDEGDDARGEAPAAAEPAKPARASKAKSKLQHLEMDLEKPNA
jgi:hypothetical protein